MDVDLIFRIAAVGILVAVLGQLLSRSGREEQALMTTLAGLIVVLMLIVRVLTMELGLICGIVLAALTLSLVLKKDAPAIAFLLVLTAGVILLLRVFSAAGSAAQRFSGLLSQCGLDSALYLPVCKAVGVAVVVRITAALCRDAGQSALAAKVEIAGAVLTLSVCLPLFEQVLDLITEWAV